MRGFLLPGFHDHPQGLRFHSGLPLQHENFFMKNHLRPNAAHCLACRTDALSMKTS